MRFFYKTTTLTILFMFVLLNTASSQSIDSIFVNMPARINPLLNKQAKLKMLDYNKKNITDSVQNALGGKSTVIKYDSVSNFIKLQNSANSKMEIFALKTTQGNSTIGVISTVGDTLQNSEIQFFNPDWSIAEITFKKPEITDWINNENNNENGTTASWASEQTAVGFITFEFDAENTRLKAQHNFLKFISVDVKKLVEPHFKHDSLQYVLQGNEWVRQ